VSSSVQWTVIPEIFAYQGQISAFSRPRAHQEWKRALAVVMNTRSLYASYVTTGNLPGMSMDDYYVDVRKQIYVFLVHQKVRFV
jgi:hypothetical protein